MLKNANTRQKPFADTILNLIFFVPLHLMRRLLPIFLMAFGWLAGWGQKDAPKLAQYSLDFTLSASDFVDSISIERDHGQVYVPVVIGGTTYRFLFDTGAGQAVIYDDTPIPDCQPAGIIRSFDAVGRCDTVPMVVLPPLTLGNITFTGLQATVQHRAVKRRNIDGIVGFDIIAKGLNVKIDIKSGLLILSDRKDFFNNEGGFEARYKLNYHVPYVELSPFSRFKEPTLFDTGSRRFYSINKKSFDRGMNGATDMMGVVIEDRARGRHAIGHSGTEPEGEVCYLTFDAMRLGGYVFSNVKTLTTQGGSHLGAALLDYGAVVFNGKRKRLFFQPYGEGNSCIVNNDRPDIAFVDEGGYASVGIIRQGSEPWKRGFRQGDIILQIDGRPVNSFASFISWGFLTGHEHRFTVRDLQGQPKEVKWVRVPRKQTDKEPER